VPPQPYQGQPAQQPYQGQPYPPTQQGYPTQPYTPQAAPAGQGYAPPPGPPTAKRRSPRGALIVLGAAVLVVALGLVAWFVVVPIFQTGPTVAATKINAIYDPALGSLGYDPTETTSNPTELFPPASAIACTDGMRAALARSTVARTLMDTKTKGMSEQGYVALYATVAEAKQAAQEIDASLLTCPGFAGDANRLGKSPGYRDYTGSLKVAGAKTSYTSATLAQYGNVVTVTVVAGITFAIDRANRLKERMDTLG
jgi:hypothetical protein